MTLLEDIQVLKKVADNLFIKVSKETDLNSNEIRVLLFLYKNEKLDIATNIVENLMISKSHVSYSVETLRNKKYIKRIQDNNDKKKFHLKLTKKAEKIIQIFEKEQNQLLEQLFQGISVNEKDQFIKICNKILENAKL